MQLEELLVARLGRGATVVRYKSESESRVRVALDRNREARLPRDRILLATNVIASTPEDLESFRDESNSLRREINLSEVWDLAVDEAQPMTLIDLAELYWEAYPDALHLVALLMYLEQNTDHFVPGDAGYLARSRESLSEVQARRRKEEENAEDAASLMRGLQEGRPPHPMTLHQQALLEYLRGYAVHGDVYAKFHTAKGLLDTLPDIAGDLQRRCFELLVGAGIFSPDEPLELHRAEITEELPANARAEAATIDLAPFLQDPQRRDLTALPTITIDDADTVDRDDALSLELGRTEETATGSVYRIAVHVTDAGAPIAVDGAIDREAYRRMATLYMPERKIEMLPPEFTQRVGSLGPGETRIGISLLIRIDESGQVLEWEVTPSIVRSQAALSYEEADLALKDESSAWHGMLTRLRQVALSWRRRREASGAVSIDRPEMDIKVGPSGDVEVRVVQRSAPARETVAEFMILCNSLLADYCRQRQLPAGYRSQPAVELDDELDRVPDGPLRRYLLMKRLPPAELRTVPAPHGGLGVPAYIQTTSPLRRYPDLVMQRQISRSLRDGGSLYTTEAIALVVQRADVQLRELARLEEDRKRYWFLKFLRQTRLDDDSSAEGAGRFTAIVLEGQDRRPALLELDEFPFRVRAELPRRIAPGDSVSLVLRGVDLWRRTGQFVHLQASS